MPIDPIMRMHFIWVLAMANQVLSLPHDRLECLQNDLGYEITNTTWKRDYVDTASLHIKNRNQQSHPLKHWVYDNYRCPLQRFDESMLCSKILGCGKKILLVGDSTMLRWILTVPYLLSGKMKKMNCPTKNGCTSKNLKCINSVQEKVINYRICPAECPLSQMSTVASTAGGARRAPPTQGVNKEKLQRETLITFVRHDFLLHAHGEQYQRSNICEHWMYIAGMYDYVVVTTGPHLPQMLAHPYGGREAAKNITNLLSTASKRIAETLRMLLKPTAKLVFRTGAVGVAEFEHNCNKPPSETAPVLTNFNDYHWDLIPYLNEVYTTAFRNYLPADQFLLMNTTLLMSKLSGCRTDYMHFKYDTRESPVLLEWQILYNILLELRQREGTKEHKPKAAINALDFEVVS